MDFDRCEEGLCLGTRDFVTCCGRAGDLVVGVFFTEVVADVEGRETGEMGGWGGFSPVELVEGTCVTGLTGSGGCKACESCEGGGGGGGGSGECELRCVGGSKEGREIVGNKIPRPKQHC